jgi:molybdopterin adenylyltransferase
VITISDTRTETTDTSGQKIRELLLAAHHVVSFYAIRKDEPEQIRATLSALPTEIELVILNGGTGIGKRDTTFEAIAAVLEKEIPGFGELFRMLSFEQIGAAAMLSRATAGVSGKRVIFSLPGSTAAVELAMTKLILPQIGHLVGLVR